MSSVSGGIDGLEVRFDDGSLVADAGLLLAGTVMDRLGLEALIDAVVRPPGAGRGSGAKALSVVASMLVGGSFIDDTDRLRAGASAQVLPFRVSAPSTVGTFLRSFTFGHLRQFDRFHELALQRAWSVGASPEVSEMTVDVDSSVCEVFGRCKGGAAYGHTKVLGYHPLDSPPRARPPTPTDHRRGHRPSPAPHNRGPPRQPLRPPQTAPARQLALGHSLHHRPATTAQPPPAHLTSR